MAKHVDNDSTMEVSSSQLVQDAKKRPAPHRAPGQDKNDVSMWIGGVVGADEFSGKGKPKAKQQIRWGAVALALIVVVGIVGGGVYYFFFRSDAKPVAAASKTPADAAIAPVALDASAVATTPADASVELAPTVDAGAGNTLQVDAISGVDGIKGKKPGATKKKVVKKKTTTTKKPPPKKK